MLQSTIGSGILYGSGVKSYDQTVLADGAVAYWKLDETSGPTAADSSGNGNDLTYNGTPAFAQPGPATGVPAVQWVVPATDNVSGTMVAAVPTGYPVTLETWQNLSNGSAQPSLISLVGPGNSDYLATLARDASSGRIGMQARRSTNVQLLDTGNTTKNVWTHIVAVWTSATDYRIYFNGLEVASATVNAPFPNTPTNRVGISALNRDSFVPGNVTGFMARCAVYDVALTAAQVLDHHTKGLLPA